MYNAGALLRNEKSTCTSYSCSCELHLQRERREESAGSGAVIYRNLHCDVLLYTYGVSERVSFLRDVFAIREQNCKYC